MSTPTTISYYVSAEGMPAKLVLARDTTNERYRFLNKTGDWQDGRGLFEEYFFNGEMGMDEVTPEQAEKVAKTFGSSLKEIKW